MKSRTFQIVKFLKSIVDFLFPKYFLPLILVAFVLYKSGFLNLPFYWDEAWSYATAIFNMHDNGLAILPGSASVELSRGHPLFFYFISALWMKLFGTSLVAVHALPLLLSCLLIMVIYTFCIKLFNQSAAIMAISFFAVQSVFLAQSTLLLPEVLLALLTMASLLFYSTRKWWLYVISASFLVLTKETGMVLIASLILDKLLLSRIFTSGKGMTYNRIVREVVYVCIPAILFTIHITFQKISFGWWFYPDHLDMLTFHGSVLLDKSSIYISRLFLQNGRNIFLLIAILGLSGLIYRNRLSEKEKHFLLFSVLFIILYGAFSVINFFTARYVLSILPVYIIAGSVVISSFLSHMKSLRAIIAFSLMILFAWQTWFKIRNESDVSLGYKDTVLVQKELVNHAEEMNWNDKLIYSAFLMQYYLSDPDLGYLNDRSAPFYQVKNLPGLPYDLYIFCSNEKDPNYEEVAGNEDLTLLKRFERNKAWAEVYTGVYNHRTPDEQNIKNQTPVPE